MDASSRERNVTCEGIRTRQLRIELDNVTEDEKSGLSCVTTNAWSECEVNCDVRWREFCLNVPEEWNGMSSDWTSREYQEMRSTDLESSKEMSSEKEV